MYLEVLVITRESFLGTEGAFLELLTNLLTQFFTPSKDVNSLRGRRDHGLELFMSSTATAIARPTLKQMKQTPVKIYTCLYTVCTSELDVATTGVTNTTELFSLVTNFPHFSLVKYFCWRINLKT